MSRLNAILEDQSLEEHFIYYAGVRHMHENWEKFLDPALPYDWTILEMYYNEMRRGTFADLKLALRKSHRIKPSDPDFHELVEEAIKVIVDRIGMEEVLAEARHFIHIVAADSSQSEGVQADYSAPVEHCPKCNHVVICLGVEDLSAEMLKGQRVIPGELYGYCPPCKERFLIPEKL